MCKESQYTAVFTYELGDDLGFSPPLLFIADKLQQLAEQQGCRLQTVFIVGDAIYCGQEAGVRGHGVVPAPRNNHLLDVHSRAKSYASILAANGFAHARELRLVVEAWDRIFALLSPDVVIADNSPIACVATRGRIPLMVAGSGFTAPPPDIAFFPAMTRNCEHETNQVLLRDTANEVLKSRGVQGVDNLPNLFAGDRRAVFAVPQLDPYHVHRKETLLGPCINIKGPLAPCERPSVFLSLPSTLPCLSGVVRALNEVNTALFCYVPGPGTVGLQMLQQIGACIYEKRPVLEHVLQEVAVVVSASADVAMATYLAGRPQVVLRRDLETSVMASELERRGSAIALDAAAVDYELSRAVKELLNNSSYLRVAQEEARRVRPFTELEDFAAVAAHECLDLLTR